MVQCAAFGCNNKRTNPGVEGSGRINSFHSFHSFPVMQSHNYYKSLLFCILRNIFMELPIYNKNVLHAKIRLITVIERSKVCARKWQNEV